MLDGVEDVDWAGLDHAYASVDLAVLLRQAASDDPEVAKQAIGELYGTLFHQGTVYPATAAAVPFLTELAKHAPTQRSDFCWLLGMVADPHHANGNALGSVQAAVAAHVAAFIPLLSDPDPEVRVAAAYALAQGAGSAAPLWDRWNRHEAEDEAQAEPRVRASLALALGQRDPVGSAAALADAVLQGPSTTTAAAALALARNQVPWPPDAIAKVVAAVEAGAEVEYPWTEHWEWTAELLIVADAQLATDLLAQLLAAPEPKTRETGLHALAERCEARRSAPALLLPMLEPLLDDPQPDVKAEAVHALRRGGKASRQFADQLSEIAGRYPQEAGLREFTPARMAVETLMRLGDPRWLDPLCAADVAGDHRISPGRARWSPESFDAVRTRMAELAALGTADSAISLLATVLGYWGPRARVAVPELLAVLPLAGPAAARGLLRVGHHAPVLAPYLREKAVENRDLEAALGVWQTVGDPEPVVAILALLLAGTHRNRASVPSSLTVGLSELGPALLPLAPVAAQLLTGVAAEDDGQRRLQVLAARVNCAATGDPTPAMPTVRAVLEGGAHHSFAARWAADLVTDLAAAHPAAVAGLTPSLRRRVDDPWTTVAAARALWRLGAPPDELIAPLIAVIPSGYWSHIGRGAIPVLVDMHATAAVPDLVRLVEQDERVVNGGMMDDIVWDDESLLDDLRTAIATLR